MSADLATWRCTLLYYRHVESELFQNLPNRPNGHFNGDSPGKLSKTKGRHQTLRTEISQKLCIPALGELSSLILSAASVGKNLKIAEIAESGNLGETASSIKLKKCID